MFHTHIYSAEKNVVYVPNKCYKMHDLFHCDVFQQRKQFLYVYSGDVRAKLIDAIAFKACVIYLNLWFYSPKGAE